MISNDVAPELSFFGMVVAYVSLGCFGCFGVVRAGFMQHRINEMKAAITATPAGAATEAYKRNGELMATMQYPSFSRPGSMLP